MKKAAFLLTILLSINSTTKSQSQFNALKQLPDPLALKATSTATLVVDTLHYYLNKYYYKTATTSLVNFPFYKSPSATVTNINITHCGSRFDVPAGETVTVTGLEAFASKTGTTTNGYIPVHILLVKLNSSSGLPEFPAIDSIVTGVGSGAVLSPSLLGGNFTHTTSASPIIKVPTPRIITSSFAVLIRNMSTTDGDTVRLLRTAGATLTNSARPTSEKCSDTDYGFVRYQDTFYSTRNFTLAPGFGIGTDYEFIVAPRITYSIQASHLVPQGVIVAADIPSTIPDTNCTREVMTFTNTSSQFYRHRQYNLNEFYRKWNLYSQFLLAPVGGFSNDSAITWNFEFYVKRNPVETRLFLPYTENLSVNGTINALTDSTNQPDCFTINQFRARLRPMGAFSKMPQLIYNEGFKFCLKYCNGDAVGINSNKRYDDFKISPNPLNDGYTQVSGLKGKNRILVYNSFGQLVFTDLTEISNSIIDLSHQPRGIYVLKVVSENNLTWHWKLINDE